MLGLWPLAFRLLRVATAVSLCTASIGAQTSPPKLDRFEIIKVGDHAPRYIPATSSRLVAVFGLDLDLRDKDWRLLTSEAQSLDTLLILAARLRLGGTELSVAGSTNPKELVYNEGFDTLNASGGGSLIIVAGEIVFDGAFEHHAVPYTVADFDLGGSLARTRSGELRHSFNGRLTVVQGRATATEPLFLRLAEQGAQYLPRGGEVDLYDWQLMLIPFSNENPIRKSASPLAAEARDTLQEAWRWDSKNAPAHFSSNLISIDAWHPLTPAHGRISAELEAAFIRSRSELRRLDHSRELLHGHALEKVGKSLLQTWTIWALSELERDLDETRRSAGAVASLFSLLPAEDPGSGTEIGLTNEKRALSDRLLSLGALAGVDGRAEALAAGSSVVGVVGDRSIGTGFVVESPKDSSLYVLTADHVLGAAGEYIEIRTGDRTYSGEVLPASTEVLDDLAVLALPKGIDLAPLRIKLADPAPSEIAWLVSWTEGSVRISSNYGRVQKLVAGSRDLLLVGVGSEPGDSGGLFVGRDGVYGMNYAREGSAKGISGSKLVELVRKGWGISIE